MESEEYQEDRRDDATGELMLGSVRLNRLSTPNINQRLSSTLLGIACLMVYSSCLRHPLSSNLVPRLLEVRSEGDQLMGACHGETN